MNPSRVFVFIWMRLMAVVVMCAIFIPPDVQIRHALRYAAWAICAGLIWSASDLILKGGRK